ncbi:T-cell antigen CD7 [Tupaia chinensis]|uniref:T-cell antigen CD7 n=1 Tax=Tupaia chinensis TaxID=246437 RepID=UPI0003C9180F|nr:T-cell antigen CD7 [Tupaia chinensis]
MGGAWRHSGKACCHLRWAVRSMVWLPLPLLLVLVLPGALGAQEVQQTPRYVVAPEGGSVSLTCSTRGPLLGLYLEPHWPRVANAIYYEDGKEPTVDERFHRRVSFSGSQGNLTITLHHLQLADSGAYTCQPITEGHSLSPRPKASTLVVVTEKPSGGAHRCQESLALPAGLAVVSFLVGLSLGLVCVLRRTQMQDACRRTDRRSACVVYEDMSCTRPNALSSPNLYQ